MKTKLLFICALNLLNILLINAQNYQFLGDYTANGTPLYLEVPGDEVSVETLEMISNSLPESYPVPDYNPHYISSGYDTDVLLDSAAEVWVTFVDEGAGYRNVLGFYTYDVNDPSPTVPTAEDITIIFPNASALGSGGGLQPGDKVKIGDFEAGTGIGWVLLANAWSSGSSTVGNGLWWLFSNPDYNPEAQPDLRYHNVLLSDPDNERIILGFEDIRRDYSSCDNDFNDAIFYVTANPYEAMRTTNYADVSSATDVTSANDGGLESNGNLAGLIAKRNFKRKQTGQVYNQKRLQSFYNKQAFAANRTSDFTALENYLPDTGMYGTETAYISSPEDLIDVTNADEIFSVDIYNNGSRVSAALATATSGAIYDHSKVICDRLNSSSLEDIRTVMVRGHQIISSKIKRASGETEYTLSFSVKLGENQNTLYSFWNIDQYPSGDYYNFQVWGGSLSQVFTIGNYIIDTLTAEKPLVSVVVDEVIPQVFVRSGYYSNGEIHLNIINKTGASELNFDASIAGTEVSERYNMSQVIEMSGDWYESIVLTTGSLFDIGFSITENQSAQQDNLYLADGPWGIDYLDELAQINDFFVDNQLIAYDDDLYEVERQASVTGMVKGNVNLFRHLLAGDQTLDVTDFETIQFNIASDHDVEIVLMTEELEDWNDRLRYTITASSENTFYNIAFTDFVDGNGNSQDINNVKTVVFSIIHDYQTTVPFTLEVADLAFAQVEETLSVTENVSENKLVNYPNPFTDYTTIKLSSPSSEVEISVYDMQGRRISRKRYKTVNNQIQYDGSELSDGLYKYILKDDLNREYVGSLLRR